MSALNILGVSKVFTTKNSTKTILSDISLAVKEGSIFGLLGLNGIGKTTTIKIMLDLLKPTSGYVEFFGQNHQDHKSRMNICYLPEKFQPSGYLTGYESVELSLEFFNRKVTRTLIAQMAERLDLQADALDKKISSYSKGMGQKIGLVACFLSGTKLLILDEPMSGLDPKTRIKVKEVATDYKNQGNTIFFSSHILADIDEICDDIAVLHNAKIVFRGKTEELKQKYNEQSLEKAFLKSIS